MWLQKFFCMRIFNFLHLKPDSWTASFQFPMETSRDAETPESTPSTSSIFGSPTEPIYTESKHTLGPDLLQDSLSLLASKNDQAIQQSAAQRKREECMEFKSGCPILFLFELCKHFKLAPEVQYRAAELFNRFMIQHIVELYQVCPCYKGKSDIIHFQIQDIPLDKTQNSVSCVYIP